MKPVTPDPSGTKPFLILSDVHLGAVPSATERALLDFLTFAGREAEGLLINGDLFDVWYAPNQFVPRRYVRPLARLAEVVESGLPVYFVGGNRDAAEWGGRVLQDDVGVRLLPDPGHLRMAGREALAAHGDGVTGSGDTYPSYRKPYGFVRNPALVWAARHLLPANWLFERLAARSGTHTWVARHAQGQSTGPKARAPAIEAWARSALAAHPEVSLVACGHSHLPALVEVERGRYYVNAGDWISHHTYVVVPASGPPEVRCWPSQSLVDWGRLDDGLTFDRAGR